MNLLLLRHLHEKLTGRIPMDAPRRSSQWPKIEKEFLSKNPDCGVCGSRKNLNVHHCQPYHLHPELELVESNLTTLCRVHHEWWGHLGNWKSFNAEVRADSAAWAQ